MNEYVTSIKAHLYDRTVSPLFGAFALSWVGWNYKFLLVISSKLSVVEKLTYIDDKLYPNILTCIGVGLVIPLLTAAIFLFVYPWLAEPFYGYVKSKQKELANIKIRIENDEIIAPEKAREIKLIAHHQQVEFEKTLDRKNATILESAQNLTDLQHRLEVAESDAHRLNSELTEKAIKWSEDSEIARDQQDRMRKQISDAYDEKVRALGASHEIIQRQKEQIQTMERELSDLNNRYQLLKKNEHPLILSEHEKFVLDLLEEQGALSRGILEGALPMSPRQTRFCIDELIGRQFIKATNAGLAVTHEGRKALLADINQ